MTETSDSPAPEIQLTHHQFQFTGSGKEYFGIWIVNLLLTIITLGIYSAWAKVRTKRYFNGNTILDGQGFGYHANPIAILKGRIVVFIVLIALNVLANIVPEAAIAVFVFYAAVIPWAVVKGLSFNANMTSYRNVRFHFKGRKRDAFVAYILLPLAASLTLGLLAPFASKASARFLGNGHSYGTSAFSAMPNAKPFYRGLWIALGILVIPAVIIGAIAISGAGSNLIDYAQSNPFAETTIGILFASIYLFLIAAFIAYAANARNVAFNHLNLQNGHKFSSDFTVGGYLWIVMSNLVLIVCTIGIFTPWAMVRMARYKAEHTHAYANGSLDTFASDSVNPDGVTAGEFLDIEGIDFGF